MAPTQPKGDLGPPAPCTPGSSHTGPVPAFLGGHADPVLLSSQPKAAPGLAPLCASAGQIAHDPGSRGQPAPAGSCKQGPRLPSPSPAHSSAGVPSLTPPLPQLSPRRGRVPGAARQSVKGQLSEKREMEEGENPGRFGAAPAPCRVPGRRAADSRPGAAAGAAPAAGARRGSASWGASEGRRTDGRAHADGRARAALRRARERPGLLLLKG